LPIGVVGFIQFQFVDEAAAFVLLQHRLDVSNNLSGAFNLYADDLVAACGSETEIKAPGWG
jgi:hypothetical protein